MNKQKIANFFANIYKKEEEDWEEISKKGFLNFLFTYFRNFWTFFLFIPIHRIFDYLLLNDEWPGIFIYLKTVFFTYLFGTIVLGIVVILIWTCKVKRYKK